MTRLLETLVRYVPDLVVRRLAAEPTPPTAPSSYPVPAAVLFADISGFSNLADQLAQRGPEGAEVLSTTLNGVFSELISLITALGGDVVIFAGDALLALWPAVEEDMSAAIRRAAQCSLALQTLFRDERIADRVQLAVRMGIGMGDVELLNVGGVNGRWVWLVSGNPLLEAARASYKSDEPGRVVLAAAAWGQVGDQYGGHVYDTGDVRLDAVRYLLPLRPVQPLTLRPEMEPALRTYIPRGVLARLVAGHASWMGELRRVTVLFINLPDLHESPSSLEHAQRATQTIQSLLYRYEGNMNKVSVDEKGATLVGAFGMPPLAHEDDAVRGVQVALATQATLREYGIRCSIGVTTGQVFCGEVGNERRSEYTILGTVVNLSAQLMLNAPDSIACDATTYQLAQSRIAFDELPPVSVKGKSEPVPIFRPHSQLVPAAREQHTLVGRTTERMILTTQLHALLRLHSPPDATPDQPPAVVVVSGDAGMGKTRLIEDLRQQANEAGALVLIDSGDVMEQTTPYHAWRGVFSRLLDLEGLSPDAAQQRIRERLAPVADLAPLGPLIHMVLPMSQPDDDPPATMMGHDRAEAVREALLWLLHEASTRTPCLLVLDDAHWLDPASWELVVAVSERIHSLLLVLTMRPMNGSVISAYLDLLRVPRVRQLELGSLSLDESMALICQRLGVARVPDTLASLIYGQANGNPFFSQELIYALRDSGLITITDGVCQIAPEEHLLRALRQSDTVQAVITSRLDRLSLAGQLTLKVASVIGQVFTVHTLQSVHPVQHDAQALTADLAALQSLDLIQPDDMAAEPTYRFKQVITQEVVYNLIPFAHRRQLHQAVAEWYERNAANHLDDLAPLISQHLLKAGSERALRYFLRAGDAALREHNYPEALRHYERAIEHVEENNLAEHTNERVAVDLQHLFVQRGRALERSNQMAAATQNAMTFRKTAQIRKDKRLELVAVQTLAALYTAPTTTPDPVPVRTVMAEGIELAQQLGDKAAEARLRWYVLRLYLLTHSDPSEALRHGAHSLELARAHHMREQIALTLDDVATAHWANGELPRSTDALEEARALWNELENIPMQTDTLARLALTSFMTGHYDQALDHSQAAYRLGASIGHLSGQASSRLVVGHIHLERGLFSPALGLMHEAVELAEQSGNMAVQVGTRADLGWVYGTLGNYRRGLELARVAYIRAQAQLPLLKPWAQAVLARLYLRDGELTHAAGAIQSMTNTLHSEAYTVLSPILARLAAGELALAQQDAARALQMLDTLLDHLARTNVSAFQGQALYLKGQALLALGRLPEASQALQAARAWAEALGAQHVLWPVLFTLGQIYARSQQTKEAHHLWQQSRDILKGLALNIADDGLRAAFLATSDVATVLNSEHLAQSPNLFYTQIGGRYIVL